MLVTGAAGYVGRHVVTALLERGYEVVAVVRPGAAGRVDSRARIVEIDVLAPDVDPAGLLSENIGAVVHLAWQDGFTHNAASHMLRLSDHFRLLTGFAAAGVPRLAVLGTMHEVGYWEGAIDADTPTNPRSLYGVAKDALRRSLTLAVPETTELAWLRCYYIFGDDRNNSSIFTRLLEAVDAGRPTMPFTTGKNRYDFIDVAELADQIAVVSTTPGVTGVINCSSGIPVSLAEQVEGFIAENQLPIRLEYGAFPDRAYDSPAVWGDATRVAELMASRPGGA
ncbi:NAD(P)-dependent oxidoreductase [Microbacterium terregens]